MRRTHFSAALLVIVMVLICAGQSWAFIRIVDFNPAFDPLVDPPTKNLIRLYWPTAVALTGVNWYFENQFNDDMFIAGSVANEGEQALANGFAAWQGVTTSFIRFTNQGSFDIPETPDANQPVFDGQNRMLVDEFGGAGAGVLGVSVITYDANTGEILDCDIVFNVYDATNNLEGYIYSVYGDRNFPPSLSTLDNDETDLQGIATHELGHLFGLEHTAVRLLVEGCA